MVNPIEGEISPQIFDEQLGYLRGHEITEAAKKLSRYATRLQNQIEELEMEIRCRGERDECS